MKRAAIGILLLLNLSSCGVHQRKDPNEGCMILCYDGQGVLRNCYNSCVRVSQ